MTVALNMYHAVAVAAVLYWLGDKIIQRVSFFSRYCIPAPLVGGLIFAAINTSLYVVGLPYITFDATLQTVFMTMFFTSVGFTVSLPLLIKGGKAVALLLALGTVMTLAQNLLGAGILLGMGEDPRLGLAVGSISLVGGPGTAAAMGPDLEAAGCVGGTVVGLAAATFGLVMGSLMGGPTARRLIVKHGLTSQSVETSEAEETVQTLDPRRFVKGFMLILFCVGLGNAVSAALQAITRVSWPGYIGAMLVAVAVRNVMGYRGQEYPEEEVETIGNMCLTIFLSMAMMTLKLWELVDLALPMIVVLSAQVLLMFIFSYFVVFRVMGRDYDAAMMTAGFIGFGMGATSNAMANMQAVSRQYGPSPTAYFVVPMVGGMFIDFVNVVVVAVMIPLLGSLA